MPVAFIKLQKNIPLDIKISVFTEKKWFPEHFSVWTEIKVFKKHRKYVKTY